MQKDTKPCLKPLALALGATLTVSLAGISAAHADNNTFVATKLAKGYQVAETQTVDDGALVDDDGMTSLDATDADSNAADKSKDMSCGNCGVEMLNADTAHDGKCDKCDCTDCKCKEGKCDKCDCADCQCKDGKCNVDKKADGEGKCGGQ